MKDLITWNELYNLGIEEIDAQHQRIVTIINELYRAMRTSTEKDVLRTIIKELDDYAIDHLATEEKYFEDFDYEERLEHVKSHNVYREKIAQFSVAYASNDAMLPFEMLEFLGKWWTDHILGEDRKYVTCFHKHGLK